MNCQHGGCRCTVPEGTDFCSDHCREHGAHGEGDIHACECGHPACQGV